MPDFCVEFHFRWNIRVVIRDFDINLEVTCSVDGIIRSFDDSFPVEITVVYKFDLDFLLVKLLLDS